MKMSEEKGTFNQLRSNQKASSVEVYATLPGPDDVKRQQLDNGIVLLCRENFNSPSVVISGTLTAGGIFDPDEKLGLADFTASALMRGTTKHSFYQIYDILESSGAGIGFGCGVNSLSFSGRALAEDLPVLLGLLAEILQYPTFPEEHIEKLRTQIMTGLAIRDQDTGDMAGLLFDRIVYDKHPYSRPIDGYRETVANIDRSNIVDFHNQTYGPKGMVMAIVGAVEPSYAIEVVDRVLGSWRNSDQRLSPELPPVVPLPKTVTQRVNIPGKYQADIIMGGAGPSSCSPEYLAASLGNSVLGQFGMMGRIGEVVREKAGLAYYAYSNLSGGIGPGPWYVSAGVDPQNVERAIDLILAEIKRFVKEGVSESELRDSQEQYVGSLPLAFESNAGVATSLINLERFHQGLDYFRRFPGLVRNVTPEEVLQVTQRYLDPEHLGIAVAGPE